MKIDDTKNYILGIIDSYGAVHSTVMSIEDGWTHGDIYPNQIFKRWSWWGHSGLDISVLSSRFTDEEIWRVEKHLKRKYCIC